MKKFIVSILSALTLIACGKPETTTTNKKLNVTVTTSFLQDMVKQLAKDYTNVQLVIPAGEDPHTYEAKPEDFEKIKKADLVLYHGLHFEGKMVDILESAGGKSVTKEFDKKDLLTMDEDGKTITDPHFWFDVDLYKKASSKAAEYLMEKLPEQKEVIQKNLATYLTKLDDLKQENIQKLNQIPENSRILVTPHDAFSYFSRQYKMQVMAPQGVSTDAELSTNDMAKTAQFIVDHKVKAIFAESTTDPARMEKLKESCASKGFEVKVIKGEGQELFSDSLAPAGQKGDSYIDMVRMNVDLMVNNLK